MSDNEKIPTPVFAFARRRDIEIEMGLTLAGTLIVDIPKTTKKPNKRQWRLIGEIVGLLTERARAQQLPDDALVYGWPDGRRPDNADAFVNNVAVKAKWAETRIVGEVRIAPRMTAAEAERQAVEFFKDRAR
jgi:hypothetical protein